MKKFNVINFDFNHNKFKYYDIIPYLVHCYEEEKNKPKTFEELKEFIERKSLQQWWSRCEYEIILKDWPCGKTEEKWDIYDQIIMNLDIITNLLMDIIDEEDRK